MHVAAESTRWGLPHKRRSRGGDHGGPIQRIREESLAKRSVSASLCGWEGKKRVPIGAESKRSRQSHNLPRDKPHLPSNGYT